MKKVFINAALLFIYTAGFCQSNPLDKKMEKAQNLIEKGKTDDADKYMVKLLADNPDYGPGWDYLCKIRYKEYKDSKSMDNLFGGNITVTTTTKDKDGKEVKTENDSLTNSVKDLLNNMKPSEVAYNKYLYTMRQALLSSTDAYYASQVMRSNFIDVATDTAIGRKALKYFNDAEEEFGKKNYNDAAKLYKRAIEEQPDFYKAALYMGDCFYYLGNYVEAINSFKAAIIKFPTALEPRKYLIDAYAKEHLYDKAVDEIILALTVYPDLSIAFVKMEDGLYLDNKKLDIKWTPRAVFPNKIITDSSKTKLNQYEPKEVPATKAPWTFYEKSLLAISKYCNAKGVITKTNPLTEAKYLEVYGWEEMLKNTTDPLLDEARRMQKDGYLDCYVLVTCFHYDLYSQYADFASKNKARIAEYYQKYIVPLK